MKKQNEDAQALEQAQRGAESELAQDYPVFNNYFASNKTPSPPKGRGITKALAAELGIKQRQ